MDNFQLKIPRLKVSYSAQDLKEAEDTLGDILPLDIFFWIFLLASRYGNCLIRFPIVIIQSGHQLKGHLLARIFAAQLLPSVLLDAVNESEEPEKYFRYK